jgi:heme exporter protein C
MHKYWWKITAALLVLYSIVGGFLFEVPRLPILNETIRNMYFHIPMWFTMTFLYLISVIYSIKYLNSGNENHDLVAVESVNVGIICCFIGLATGMIWAKFTWGDYWTNDPKLNGSAISTLMYLAFIVLRGSINEEQKKAKISSIYNIFAFPIMIVLIFVLPRLTDSLHPGNGGNPGFSNYDLDNKMRLVFYPAVIGWILIGTWIVTIRYRIRLLENSINQID